MSHWTATDWDRIDAQRRQAAENLKRCPVCDAVNSCANAECFVCRWSGAFERDPLLVQEALDELIDRCPELVMAMKYFPEPEPWWARTLNFCRAALRRRFEIRV